MRPKEAETESIFMKTALIGTTTDLTCSHTKAIVSMRTKARTIGILSERCSFISTSKEDQPPTSTSCSEASVWTLKSPMSASASSVPLRYDVATSSMAMSCETVADHATIASWGH